MSTLLTFLMPSRQSRESRTSPSTPTCVFQTAKTDVPTHLDLVLKEEPEASRGASVARPMASLTAEMVTTSMISTMNLCRDIQLRCSWMVKRMESLLEARERKYVVLLERFSLSLSAHLNSSPVTSSHSLVLLFRTFIYHSVRIIFTGLFVLPSRPLLPSRSARLTFRSLRPHCSSMASLCFAQRQHDITYSHPSPPSAPQRCLYVHSYHLSTCIRHSLLSPWTKKIIGCTRCSFGVFTWRDYHLGYWLASSFFITYVFLCYSLFVLCVLFCLPSIEQQNYIPFSRYCYCARLLRRILTLLLLFFTWAICLL